GPNVSTVPYLNFKVRKEAAEDSGVERQRNKIDTHTKYCTITHGYTIIIRNMLENASRAMTARKGGFNSDECVGARPTGIVCTKLLARQFVWWVNLDQDVDLVPDLVVVRCVCHSLHLCAEYACKELPRQLEYLIRECHNYFSLSPKRLAEYAKFYETNRSQPARRIPKLAGTRWLAREAAVNIVLDQWDELFNFFKRAMLKDKCYAAEQLVNIMNVPAYKAFLTFLKLSLNPICKTNLMFQDQESASGGEQHSLGSNLFAADSARTEGMELMLPVGTSMEQLCCSMALACRALGGVFNK
ncbi:unnamed protein product, partial [Nesidiocoris tenuis]